MESSNCGACALAAAARSAGVAVWSKASRVRAECNSGPAPAMQAARRPWRPSCLFLPPLPLRPGRCRHARHQWLHGTAGRPPAAETPLRMQRHFPALVKKPAMLLARETPKKQRQPRKNKARESFGERNSAFVWFVASFSGALVYNVLP